MNRGLSAGQLLVASERKTLTAKAGKKCRKDREVKAWDSTLEARRLKHLEAKVLKHS